MMILRNGTILRGKSPRKKILRAADVDVVILAGGRGERLGSLTDETPKPMVKIGGKPFLEILISRLVHFGFRTIIIAAGYRGDVIQAYLKKKLRKKIRIRFSQENKPLGTAGGLKHCAKLLRSDNVLVLNGDTYCPVEFDRFLNFHTSRQSPLSVVAVPREPLRQDAGTMEISSQNEVLSFKEKSKMHGRFINAGIYLIRRKSLASIPPARYVSLEKDFFPAYRENIYAYVTTEKLYDIGTPERLNEFTEFYESNRKRLVSHAG